MSQYLKKIWTQVVKESLTKKKIMSHNLGYFIVLNMSDIQWNTRRDVDKMRADHYEGLSSFKKKKTTKSKIFLWLMYLKTW